MPTRRWCSCSSPWAGRRSRSRGSCSRSPSCSTCSSRSRPRAGRSPRPARWPSSGSVVMTGVAVGVVILPRREGPDAAGAQSLAVALPDLRAPGDRAASNAMIHRRRHRDDDRDRHQPRPVRGTGVVRDRAAAEHSGQGRDRQVGPPATASRARRTCDPDPLHPRSIAQCCGHAGASERRRPSQDRASHDGHEPQAPTTGGDLRQRRRAPMRRDAGTTRRQQRE